MYKHIKTKRETYQRRANRVRSKVRGTAVRPRAAVYCSLRHNTVQLIDDEAGVTLAAAGDRELKNKKGTKTEKAQAVGVLIAEKAAKANIKAVVFDRRGKKFHGRVKAIAAGMKQGGLTL